MLYLHLRCFIYLSMILRHTTGFISSDIVAVGADSSASITHSEMTEYGFIRSLARYFYETRIGPRNINGSVVNEKEYFAKNHTINELYKLAYPRLTSVEIELYSLPLKYILDSIVTQNVMVDLNTNLQKLSAAHYDNEAVVNSSRRIVQFKKRIVNDARNPNQDLTSARELLGQLFHTLQDFYSHSNWVELGKTTINELIGMSETIGKVATPDQPTCTNIGCEYKEKPCTFLEVFTVRRCPIPMYICKNNVLPEIIAQEIITTGYTTNGRTETGEIITKPANVGKCSHGSFSDTSANVNAVGGINKDSLSYVYSPHPDLHLVAADLGIKATEAFLNTFRREIGDANFDRFFKIKPSLSNKQMAVKSISKGERFRFIKPELSVTLSRKILAGRTRTKHVNGKLLDPQINEPTHDLSDLGVNMNDLADIHSTSTVGN